MRDLSLHPVWCQSLALLTTAIFALHWTSSSAIAQQRQMLNQSPVQVPATTPPSLPDPGKLPTNQGPESIKKMTGPSDRGTSANPNSSRSYSRPRAVERQVAGRVAVGSAVL